MQEEVNLKKEEYRFSYDELEDFLIYAKKKSLNIVKPHQKEP